MRPWACFHVGVFHLMGDVGPEAYELLQLIVAQDRLAHILVHDVLSAIAAFKAIFNRCQKDLI